MISHYAVANTIREAARFMSADETGETWESMAAGWASALKQQIVVAVQLDDFDINDGRAWRDALEDPARTEKSGGQRWPVLARRIALLMLGTVADNGGEGFSDQRFERLMSVFESRGWFGYPDPRADDDAE